MRDNGGFGSLNADTRDVSAVLRGTPFVPGSVASATANIETGASACPGQTLDYQFIAKPGLSLPDHSRSENLYHILDFWPDN